MRNLLSIRMRASKAAVGRKDRTGTRREALRRGKEVHISGAEGLYDAASVQRVVRGYIQRAFTHPKGKPEKIVLTIEKIEQRPILIPALPVTTINCRTLSEGKSAVIKLLQSLGISEGAIAVALGIIKKGDMRGASLVAGESGNRYEPDRQRGIRVSRIGISKESSKHLSSKLSRHGIDTETVREALALASKVVSHGDVVAELCVSDDPDYTTGYVASKKFGYVRIPHIKRKGSRDGGRAFFMKEGLDVEKTIAYMEIVPVLIEKIASCRGVVSLNEILNSTYQ